MKKYLFIFTLIFAFLPFIEKLEAQERLPSCNCPNGLDSPQIPCNPIVDNRTFDGRPLTANQCLYPCHCPVNTVCKVPPGASPGEIGECRAPSS